jgi:hypothetical protein
LTPAKARTRLAAVEAELAKLRYRHDIAFSAFRFEEATALGPAIKALEREQASLAASIPPESPKAPAPTEIEVPRGRRGPRQR